MTSPSFNLEYDFKSTSFLHSGQISLICKFENRNSKFEKNLYFKREDLHPYGSHKGRSIPKMIDNYESRGYRHFAISSSGNAAIAAALYIGERNTLGEKKIFLDVLIGNKVNKIKKRNLQELSDEYIRVEQTMRPLQKLFEYLKIPSVKSLRQSTDDTALRGYYELARELCEIPDLNSVFIPTSSGTTAEALGEQFAKLGKNIEIHAIQTTACHPISGDFDKNGSVNSPSIADAIVDKIVHRKEKVLEIIRKSGGRGWTANDNEIRSAQKVVKECSGLDISANSALSVAGLIKAKKSGKNWTGSVLCLITGK